MGIPTASPIMSGRLLEESDELDTPLATTEVDDTVKPPIDEPDKPEERAEAEARIPEELVSLGVAVPEATTDPYLIDVKVIASTLVLEMFNNARISATILDTSAKTAVMLFELILMPNPTLLLHWHFQPCLL